MDASNVSTDVPKATYQNELLLNYLPVSLFFAISALVGVIGNFIVVKFYGRNTHPKTSFTYLVRWLAWADSLVCALLFAGAVEIGMNINFNHKYVCKASYFLFQWAIYASTWILAIISIDRYRKICQPFKSQMTTRFARIAVKVILLPTCLWAVRNVITYDIVTADVTLDTANGTVTVTGYYCGSTTDTDLQIYVEVSNMVDIVTCSSLFLIYLIAYGLITHKLVAHRKALQAWKGANPKSTENNSNNKETNVERQSNDKDTPRDHSESQSTSTPVDVHVICLAYKAISTDKGHIGAINEAMPTEVINEAEDSGIASGCDHNPTTSEPSDISNAGTKSRYVKPQTDKVTSKHGHGIKRSEYQITIMMLWVTVIFLITLSSFFIGTLVLRNEPQSEQALSPLTFFMIKCVFLNSVSNPIIYYICNATFRVFVKEVLMCKNIHH